MNHFSFNDLPVGTSSQFSFSITERMILTYADLCGDVSPLHVDYEFARSKGFKSRVAHGLLTSSLYSTLVGVYLPGAQALLLGADITFHAPVYGGDVLQVSGVVKEVFESVRVVEVRALIKNQEGKKVSSAKLRVGFNER